MKLIIAGTRTLNVTELWLDHTLSFFVEGYETRETVTEIVSGEAQGIDTCGEMYASSMDIPVTRFPADWETHGKAAGPIRNREMAEYADALLLVWDGESRGSANMKSEMEKLGKPVFEVIMRGLL